VVIEPTGSIFRQMRLRDMRVKRPPSCRLETMLVLSLLLEGSSDKRTTDAGLAAGQVCQHYNVSYRSNKPQFHFEFDPLPIGKGGL
jgi:hypothetical protein